AAAQFARRCHGLLSRYQIADLRGQWTATMDSRHGKASVAQGEEQSAQAHGHGPNDLLRPAAKAHADPGRRQLDAWQKGKALEFREFYAFDPKTQEVKRLADGPTAFYSSHLAYDGKRDLFLAVAVFNKGEQPSGMFAYDPRKDAWRQIKPVNDIP